MNISTIIEILTQDAPSLIMQHLVLVVISLSIALIIAIPTGIILTRSKMRPHANKFISVFNTAQGVPSLAFIAIFMRFLGIGIVPSIAALSLYGLLPIAQNTIAGINNIDPEILESAKGVGMPKMKVLMKIELPLALPIIIAGIQTSSVLIIGTAAIAQLIGAGGLGRLIFTGISQFRPELTLIGASLAAIIAIIFDRSLAILNKKLTQNYK